jgi:hypothetical protein
MPRRSHMYDCFLSSLQAAAGGVAAALRWYAGARHCWKDNTTPPTSLCSVKQRKCFLLTCLQATQLVALACARRPYAGTRPCFLVVLRSLQP